MGWAGPRKPDKTDIAESLLTLPSLDEPFAKSWLTPNVEHLFE
jgi:hypothetical protein